MPINFIYPLIAAILIYYLNFNLFLFLHFPLLSLFFLALTTQYAGSYTFQVPSSALCYDYYSNHHKIDHPDWYYDWCHYRWFLHSLWLLLRGQFHLLGVSVRLLIIWSMFDKDCSVRSSRGVIRLFGGDWRGRFLRAGRCSLRWRRAGFARGAGTCSTSTTSTSTGSATFTQGRRRTEENS